MKHSRSASGAAAATMAAAALFVSAPAAAQHPAPELAALRSAVRGYRTTHEGAIVRELAALLAIPNLAHDSLGIRRNADALISLLQRRGLTTRLLETPGAPPVVFGELRANGARRTVILYAHYDGQPVDASDWATPPWSPTLRTGTLADGGTVVSLPGDSAAHIDAESRLYARSAGDDKASIIAMLAALDALRASGVAPTVNIKLLFEGEEEAGSPHLAEILRRNATLLQGDVFLLCDGPDHQSGRQQLLFGVRGITGLELTVFGPTRALHSGHYGNWAPNPAVLLAHLIASMRDDDGRIAIAHYYDDVGPLSAAEHAAIRALPVPDTALRRSLGLATTESDDALLAERIMLPAINVRGIRAGAVGAQAANAVPTEARASFDFRLVPNETPAHVRDVVNAHLRAQGYFVTSDSVTMAMRLAHPRIARVQWDSAGYPASRTRMDLPISRAVIRAVSDGIGSAPLVVPSMGGSAPSYLFEKALHMPVVIVPIANYDDNQHAANENLRIGNLWNGIDLYAGIFARLAADWPATQR